MFAFMLGSTKITNAKNSSSLRSSSPNSSTGSARHASRPHEKRRRARDNGKQVRAEQDRSGADLSAAALGGRTRSGRRFAASARPRSPAHWRPRRHCSGALPRDRPRRRGCRPPPADSPYPQPLEWPPPPVPAGTLAPTRGCEETGEWRSVRQCGGLAAAGDVGERRRGPRTCNWSTGLALNEFKVGPKEMDVGQIFG